MKRMYIAGTGIILILTTLCHVIGDLLISEVALQNTVVTVGLFVTLLMYFLFVSVDGGDDIPIATEPHEEPLQNDEVPLQLKHVQKLVEDDVANVDFAVIGTNYRRESYLRFEEEIDRIIDSCIALIHAHIKAHTIAVFLPSSDNSFVLRCSLSESEEIKKDALIHPGVGVLGSYLKEGKRSIEEIPDSNQLYYYNEEEAPPVQSLIFSPILTNDIERGLILVDSTEKKRFTEEDSVYLSRIAHFLGSSIYYAYLYNQHKLDHERLVAMSSTEKFFYQEQSVDGVLDKLLEMIPFAFHCNRLTISLRDGGSEQNATIYRVWGEHTDLLDTMTYSLKDRSIANLVYSKNLAIVRNFSDARYEVRFGKMEPEVNAFKSFMAIPIGVNECRGLILLESFRKNQYTDQIKDLLCSLVASASVALEKILILRQTENLAIRDGLTGLYNHRQFQILLKEAITRSVRYQSPLALVICDIDHFKQVNDTYGHRFGDKVLKTIAGRLQASIREGIDNTARYGGEEFALILAETDSKSAIETVNRIRLEIGNIKFQTPEGNKINCTMSFGIAVYGVHAKERELLIKHADKALYKAKDNGRNRVEVYFDEEKDMKRKEQYKREIVDEVSVDDSSN